MSYDEMKQELGLNKTFLRETELPAIIALSFYPELKHTQIKFEFKKIATTGTNQISVKQTTGYQFANCSIARTN